MIKAWKKWRLRVELDGTHDPFGELAVVGTEVGEEVDATRGKQEAADRPLDRDQPD